jgi:membrane protein required for colicin V production
MIIDTIFVVLLAFAVFKGYSKGLIMAVFSVLGFIVGLAAALKLSNTVAQTISTQTNLGKWAPALAFFGVFIATAIVIRIVGNIVQKTFETVMLGWANKIGGILLFAFLYSTIYSVFIFYAVQLKIFTDDTTNASVSYGYLKQLGPWVINGFAVIMPWFKEMFTNLETYFSKFAIK